MMGERDQQINLAIKEIKELEFFVNETVELGQAYDFNYQVDILHSIPKESVMVTVTANYLLKKKAELFMKGKTATTFLIKNMRQYSQRMEEKDVLDLPKGLLVTLFSISFSHTRALLAKSSAGTRYSHMLMPLINPEEEFKKISGDNFKTNPEE